MSSRRRLFLALLLLVGLVSPMGAGSPDAVQTVGRAAVGASLPDAGGARFERHRGPQSSAQAGLLVSASEESEQVGEGGPPHSAVPGSGLRLAPRQVRWSGTRVAAPHRSAFSLRGDARGPPARG